MNTALLEGNATPKSKIVDLVPRIAVAFHVIERIYYKTVNSVPIIIEEEISQQCILQAIHFVECLEEQKHLFGTVRYKTFSILYHLLFYYTLQLK